MFDIGFSELVVIFVVGLVVLGPQRLPIAIRTVMGWINTVRGLVANVQSELSQELKLQELQESIKKAEKLNMQQLSPELAETVQDLKESAQKIKTELERKAKEATTEVEEQVADLKESIEKSDNEGHQEETDEQATLSPAEIAERAEENEDMIAINNDYFPEDSLADVDFQPSEISQKNDNNSDNENTIEKKERI